MYIIRTQYNGSYCSRYNHNYLWNRLLPVLNKPIVTIRFVFDTIFYPHL